MKLVASPFDLHKDVSRGIVVLSSISRLGKSAWEFSPGFSLSSSTRGRMVIFQVAFSFPFLYCVLNLDRTY